MTLKDKIAIVTGSGRGIGKAAALMLAKEGAKIVVTARNEKEIRETEKEIKKISDAISVKGDLRNSKDAKKIVDAAIDKFGRIDILVNNAGVAYYEDFSKMSEDKAREIIDTNLNGIFNITREALKHMKEGTIINVSSGAGKHGIGGLAVYCASKFGVIGFTESLAQELDGVKVYAVCPGGVDTKMYSSLFGSRGGLTPEQVAEKIIECAKNKHPSGSSIDVRR